MSVPEWFAEQWIHCGVRITPCAGGHTHRPSATAPRNARDEWSFYAIQSGALYVEQLQQNLTLHAGNACIIPPGYAFHEKELTNTDQTRIVIVHFVVMPAPGWNDPLHSLGLPQKVNYTDRTTFETCCEKLLGCVNGFKVRSTDHHLLANSLLQRLLVDFFVDGFQQEVFPDNQENAAPDWLKDLRNYLRKQFSKSDFRYGDLVKASGHSGSYVSHQFSRYFGEPPMRYLQRMRLKLACRLLRSNTTLSIGEVAAKCGYSDQSLFCRHFRSLLGVSPTQWRRSGKQVPS